MPFFIMSNERSCPLNSFKTFLFQQVFRDCISFQKHLKKNVLGADPRTPLSDRVTRTKNNDGCILFSACIFFNGAVTTFLCLKLYRYISNTTINIRPSITYYKIFYKKLLLGELGAIPVCKMKTCGVRTCFFFYCYTRVVEIYLKEI